MSKDSEHKKFRWGKLFLWIFVTLIVLIGAASTYIIINANQLITEHLPNYIYTKTDSVYKVSYDSLHVDFKKRSIHVNNLNIIPDSIHSIDSSKTYYEFSTKHLDLNQLYLFSLWRHKKFRAESFKIEKPYFSSSKDQNINFRNLSLKDVKKGDSLSIPVFNEIFMDTILVINAELKLDTILSAIKKFPTVDLEINHFKLGGKKYTDTPYPFDVSDISLNVHNLHQNLPDSLHFITIEKINLSLLNSTIKTQNISLQPNTDTLTFENRYAFQMPEMTLHTNQIEKLLANDSLYFDKITLKNPKINIKFGSKVTKGTPLNEINLHKLIEKNIHLVKIDQLSIENANVSLTPSNSDTIAQRFETLFINLYDFESAPFSYKQSDRLLSAKNATLSLKKFILTHTDEVHRLTISDLKASTAENRVSTGNITFAPTAYAEKNKVNTLISIQSEGITFKEVDFLEMYHNQRIPMEELIVKKSTTKITYNRKHVRKGKNDKSLILEKLEDYVQGVYVKNTSIKESYLEYNYSTAEKEKGFFRTNYNFELSRLSVDSATFYQSDKIFFAQDFELNFSDVSLQLADDVHRLLVDNIDLSSKDKSAVISDLKIIPLSMSDNKKASFDIHFPKIRLSGANLHHAFFNNELYIAYLNVQRPVFNINKKGKWITGQQETESNFEDEIYSLMSDYLKKIHISNLSMDNGTLNFQQKQIDHPNFELSNLFSVKLKNFIIDDKAHLQKDKLFFSDDIDLILKDHSFTLADGVHKVQAKEIGILSSEDRVYIENGRLYPDILSDEFKNLPISVFATIPDMQILNADIFGLFNLGHLKVSSVKLSKPDIKILFQKTRQQNKSNKNKPVFLINDLKSFSTNKISISNGKLELANYVDHKSNTFIKTNLDFEMDRFFVEQIDNAFSTNYDNFDISLDELTYELPDKIHALTIKEFTYSLNNKNVDISNLQLAPKAVIDLKSREQFINVDIPVAQIKGFDFNKYLDDESIELNQLNLKEPIIDIVDQRIEKQGKFSPYNMKIHEKTDEFAENIKVGNIDINNASFKYKGDKNLNYNHINIQTTNFIADQNGTNNTKLLQSDEVSLQLDQLKGKTKDDFFRYSIDDIRVNQNGQFSIANINLIPLVSEKTFARQKKFQADYFEIKKARVEGNDLDIKSLIENGDILINELNIDLPNASIHRDKTFPLDPNQRPKLPQQAIRDLKQKIDIKRTEINIERFDYSEQETGSTRKSYIFVDNGKAFINNLTNVSSLIKQNQYMNVVINGDLMGKGKTQIEMVYNIPSFGNEFTFKAICENMDLPLLNPMTESGLNVSIKDGFNHKLDVYFEANEDSAVGELKFAYNDLKISVLNKRGDEIKEDRFISFLVNSIAVKSDNPKPGRILLPAKFIKHRDKQRSVVGYCWQSIFKGIKVTMGLKEKNENN